VGTGKADFTENLLAGNSGIGPIRAFDTRRFSSKLGAEVGEFSPRSFISVKNLRKMDRLSRMVAASARMALEDAGLTISPANRDRTGIVLGTSFGSTDVAARFAGVIFTDGPAMANPILVPNTVMNAPAGHTAIELGFSGINSTINHREASAETAIAYAAAEIERNSADVVLAGGGDILSEFCFEVLSRFAALSPLNGGPEGARPFDIDRNGPVVGEGAGILCLETAEHAAQRGVQPYCEIAGWGMSAAPAPHNDWPADPKGPVLAMRRAIASAGISSGDIDSVSASASGGKKLDRLEALALAEVFDERSKEPWISSIKGAVGESFSSGGIRTAAAALSMQAGIVPPTVGLQKPLASLELVAGRKREGRIDVCLLNGFSSGGTFTSLVLRKPMD
jgi:3-oxoacyl-[acyl-carrier-protein] synthase II